MQRRIRAEQRAFGSSEIIRFAASSLVAFAVDFTLYSLLISLFSGLGALSVPLSNIPARVVSALLNFWINKRVVFNNPDSVFRTGAKYFALAACILTGNTALIYLLVTFLSADKLIAKVSVESLFFLVSWYVQRTLIFRRKARRSIGQTARPSGRPPVGPGESLKNQRT